MAKPQVIDTKRIEQATERLQALRDALCAAFYERDAEVESMLTAVVAEEHVLLLGPPGTAKSALSVALSHALGGTHFSILLTKFSVPEEVFGPTSLKGLENDEYRRVTKGFFPEATLAFFDEIFKANSSILNTLLTGLNERQFDNGGRQAIPLELCVGASNELPQDDGLAALYDRFVLRHWVAPIASEDSLRALLTSAAEPSVCARLSTEDLAELRAARDRVVVPDDVIDMVLQIKSELATSKGITASDRRWRKIVKLVRAHAVLEGRNVATVRDLRIAAHALWDDPDNRGTVAGLIYARVNPNHGKATRYLDAAQELRESVDLNTANVAVLGDLNEKLQQNLDEITALGLDDPDVAEVHNKVAAMHRQVLRMVRNKLRL
jgi:MoxR-like ATPase